MREYNERIEEALTNGIHRDVRRRKNLPFLTDAYNLKVSEYGLKFFEPFVDPFSGSVPVNFPFPQIIRGDNETLLADETRIYTVNTSVVPWQRTQIDFVDLEGAASNPTAGGPWHFVDYKSGWLLLNGSSVVMKDVSGRLTGNSDTFYAFDDVTIKAGCYHRGRTITGGFDASNIWGDRWSDLFQMILEASDDGLELSHNDIDKSYVLWSSVGGGDFPLWLFKPVLVGYGITGFEAVDYGYSLNDISSSRFIEMLRRNEFGFMPMDWDGEVIGLGSMGKHVIVLGTEGVTALTLVSGMNTYGKTNLLSTGIATRSSFHVSERRALLLDREGSLWSIGPSLEIERLGYEDSLSSLLGNDIVITHNEEDDEYYISDGTECYVFSRQGLTRVSHHPTSLHFVDGGVVGLFSDDIDNTALVVSGVYDLGLRGLKTITSINLGSAGGGDVDVAIDYRYSSNDNFQRSPFTRVNKEGNAYVCITCLDFRVVVRASDYTNYELDYIDVKFQIPDKRQIRGAYAN